MRRACGNPYTGLAYLDTSETVNDGQAMNRKFCADLRANLAHFSQCHRLVGLVLEVKRAPSLKVVAHETIENHDGAVFRTFQILEKLAHLDWLVHELKYVIGNGCLPAAADRRQKRHFVAIHKRSPPFGIFLIYRSRNRSSKFSEPRKPPRVTLEKIFHASAFGEVGIVLRRTYDFFELPKKKHSHTHEEFILSRRRLQSDARVPDGSG